MKIKITKVHGIIYPIELAQLLGAYVATVYAVLLDGAKDNDGFVSISNNEIGKKSGIPSRSIPNIITKLETADLITRHLNQGCTTKYYVKNILLEEDKPSEQTEKSPPEQVPERQQTYQMNSVEYVWRSSNGGLKQGYKWYGERKKVALTDDEYQKLCEKFGESVVKDYIHRIELNRAKNGKYYPDYAAAIEDWIEHDDREIKKKQTCKDKPISSQKRKKIDKYLDGVNVFEDDVKRQEMNEIGEYDALVNVFPYGEYGHIHLKSEEYDELCEKYGKAQIDRYIKKIDLWCEDNGKIDKGKATIELWIVRDIEKAHQKDADLIDPERKKELDEYQKLVNVFEEDTYQ